MKIVATGKARQLYNILKNEINDGKYEDDSRLPSIRAMAQEYQMSANTVNTAIAMLVSEGLAVVREGKGTYVHKSVGKARMIGVMLFDFGVGLRVDNMILAEVQKNITSNYYLTLVNTSNRYDVFCDGLERLIDNDAAGLLILPPKEDPKFIKDRQRVESLLSQKPVVFINRGIPGIEADMYSMDLRLGLENALEHLLANGKRRTAIVLHDSPKFVEEEMAAYSGYVIKHGIKPDPRFLIPWSEDNSEIRMRLEPIINEIDSIIAPDNALLPLADLIEGTGRDIPSELSLVGINDTIISRMYNPPLTSISFPVERIGRHAIQKLIRRIEGTDTTAVSKRNFPPELIIRKT